VHPHIPKLRTLLSGLAKVGVSTPKVVVIDSVAKGTASLAGEWDPSWKRWSEFVEGGAKTKLGRTADGEIEWERLDFDWPLWILFSSGTTGLPKYN
jgi:acetoacetyl-CoA synthetase